MEDYGNLAALLGEANKDSDSESSAEEQPDGLDGQDSRNQVFDTAAKEAFHALKEGDAQSFAEALKAALGAC